METLYYCKTFFFRWNHIDLRGRSVFFTFSSFTVVNHLVLCYPCYDHVAFSTYLPNESSVFHITCGSSVKSFTVRQSKHVLKSRYVLYYRKFAVDRRITRSSDGFCRSDGNDFGTLSVALYRYERVVYKSVGDTVLEKSTDLVVLTVRKYRNALFYCGF